MDSFPARPDPCVRLGREVRGMPERWGRSEGRKPKAKEERAGRMPAATEGEGDPTRSHSGKGGTPDVLQSGLLTPRPGS